jgi:hypothetical protein
MLKDISKFMYSLGLVVLYTYLNRIHWYACPVTIAHLSLDSFLAVITVYCSAKYTIPAPFLPIRSPIYAKATIASSQP